MTIRPARSDDLPVLVEIERAAGQTFLQLDMDLFADHDPGTVEELAPYADGGRAFVSVDADDTPVGYLLLDLVDGAAHIEQVSVHPDHARKGLGRALIEHAASWASARDLHFLTLTTYVARALERPLLRAARLPLPHDRRGDTGTPHHPRARARARSRGLAANLHAPQPRLTRTHSAHAQRPMRPGA